MIIFPRNVVDIETLLSINKVCENNWFRLIIFCILKFWSCRNWSQLQDYNVKQQLSRSSVNRCGARWTWEAGIYFKDIVFSSHWATLLSFPIFSELVQSMLIVRDILNGNNLMYEDFHYNLTSVEVTQYKNAKMKSCYVKRSFSK